MKALTACRTAICLRPQPCSVSAAGLAAAWPKAACESECNTKDCHAAPASKHKAVSVVKPPAALVLKPLPAAIKPASALEVPASNLSVIVGLSLTVAQPVCTSKLETTSGKLSAPHGKAAQEMVMSALGCLCGQSEINIEHGGHSYVLSAIDVGSVIESLLKEGFDADSIVKTTGVLIYPKCQVLYALAVLIASGSPLTLEGILVELDRRTRLHADDPSLPRTFKQINHFIKQPLVELFGLADVAELDKCVTFTQYSVIPMLKKIAFLKQAGVNATNKEFFTYNYVLTHSVETLSKAVKQLKQAGIQHATLPQLYHMIRFKRISSSDCALSKYRRGLAQLFNCTEQEIASVSRQMQPLYCVGINDLRQRLSLLNSLGFETCDVMRVPLVLAFAEANVLLASAELDTLMVGKLSLLDKE